MGRSKKTYDPNEPNPTPTTIDSNEALAAVGSTGGDNSGSFAGYAAVLVEALTTAPRADISYIVPAVKSVVECLETAERANLSQQSKNLVFELVKRGATQLSPLELQRQRNQIYADFVTSQSKITSRLTWTFMFLSIFDRIIAVGGFGIACYMFTARQYDYAFIAMVGSAILHIVAGLGLNKKQHALTETMKSFTKEMGDFIDKEVFHSESDLKSG